MLMIPSDTVGCKNKVNDLSSKSYQMYNGENRTSPMEA